MGRPPWFRPGHPASWLIVASGLVAVELLVVNMGGGGNHWWTSEPHLGPKEQAEAESAAMHERFRAWEASKLAETQAAADRARAADEKEKKEAADKTAAAAKAHADATEALRGKTPADRLDAIKTECLGDCDHGALMDVVAAAANDAEGASLKRVAAAAEAKAEQTHVAMEARDRRRGAAELAKTRRTFADTYETTLLEEHRNPDGVSTGGTNDTTLVVRGWFCTRQYIYDFQKTATAEVAKSIGFKRLECYSAVQSYSVDL